jgi:hypothetical protein
MHPPRDDFIATMTDAEHSAFDAHAGWLRTLLADGVLIVAGPCLGQALTIYQRIGALAARRVHPTIQNHKLTPTTPQPQAAAPNRQGHQTGGGLRSRPTRGATE